MKKIGITILVVLGVLITSIACAANLYGIVSDKNGKPVEVKVTLKDDKGAAVGQPVTTDKKGAYAFKDIKPGSYVVVVGAKDEWKIFVGPGETRRDFSLK
ncbi:MAG TPA: carboxypeptidase-like regulatory domain-containing protein [Smithella sp.]|nr:carboxypeptidase-like regulatory domain-containing protein [Smithella sp.]HQN70746.1 carboxypeptidase-like regulatory domain-containing protein [Smithella sp.]HQP41375.1 carboxypeptidase-like regulatory domain-containing protein [Smithella sp.]